MLSGKSVIRQLSEFATERGKEIGYENVFDYSLGNPSVPVPEKFTKVMIKMLQEKSPVALHGYSPSLGITEVREKVAASLQKRFGIPYTKDHISWHPAPQVRWRMPSVWLPSPEMKF